METNSNGFTASGGRGLYSREQIARALDTPIAEVANDLGLELKKSGHRYKMLCLLHDERRPSMLVGGVRNICKCFSCNGVLNTIGLVMNVNDCSYPEAIKFLINEEPLPPEGGSCSAARSKLYLRPASSLSSSSSSTCFSPAYVQSLLSTQNSLCRCLQSRFSVEDVHRVTRDYMLGNWVSRSHCDNTVFPLIDGHGRIRDLKIQHYDTRPQSPRFGHSDSGTYWLGSVLRSEGQFPEDAEFTHDVLFGEHLLRLRPDATVGLVESPKNAVVAACAMPDMVWVATGNKGMLSRPVLEPLRNRSVLVFPDRDAHGEWVAKLASMRDMATFVVSDAGQTEEEKSDIADVLLGGIRNEE